jgi:hypothetical protein
MTQDAAELVDVPSIREIAASEGLEFFSPGETAKQVAWRWWAVLRKEHRFLT